MRSPTPSEWQLKHAGWNLVSEAVFYSGVLLLWRNRQHAAIKGRGFSHVCPSEPARRTVIAAGWASEWADRVCGAPASHRRRVLLQSSCPLRVTERTPSGRNLSFMIQSMRVVEASMPAVLARETKLCRVAAQSDPCRTHPKPTTAVSISINNTLRRCSDRLGSLPELKERS
ncbi:hypothetical protein LX36DRAFT_398750 [Colletotrichum falcatum]|nr:hypothetical protein LX36DRAFT_398750 [Colletotrichum falcatum]